MGGYRASTAHSFDQRYRHRTFKWQGKVMTIKEGFDLVFARTKSVILVHMYPSRYKREGIPDIALLFGDERNAEVAVLKPDDWIEFEATMSAHGHRGDPEVMTLWHVAAMPRPSPLSSSAGTQNHGRAGENIGLDEHGNSIASD